MALTKKLLVGNEQLAAAAAQLGSYAVPANTTTEIHSIILHNTNTTAEKVILYLVPSAGSATDANKVLAKTLAADETWEWNPYVYMSTGYQIHGATDTASEVSVHVYGAEITQV